MPGVLAEKWSELSLLGKQTRKMLLCGILGHWLEMKQHRKAEMVWVVGGWPCPRHPLTWGRGKRTDHMYISYGRYHKQGQASCQHPISRICHEKSTPWSQLIRNLRSVIPKTSYLRQTQAKGGKREEKRGEPSWTHWICGNGFLSEEQILSLSTWLSYNLTPSAHNEKILIWLLTSSVWEKTI